MLFKHPHCNAGVKRLLPQPNTSHPQKFAQPPTLSYGIELDFQRRTVGLFSSFDGRFNIDILEGPLGLYFEAQAGAGKGNAFIGLEGQTTTPMRLKGLSFVQITSLRASVKASLLPVKAIQQLELAGNVSVANSMGAAVIKVRGWEWRVEGACGGCALGAWHILFPSHTLTCRLAPPP